MKIFFFMFFGAVLLASSFALAVPDAPASVWFEGNASPHYANRNFSINWTIVANEDISNYTVYIINASDRSSHFAISNDSVSGAVIDAVYGILKWNYTFNVSAVNKSGTAGPSAASDWIYIDIFPPTLSFSPSTPANNTYQQNTIASITFNISEQPPMISGVVLSWNNVNETIPLEILSEVITVDMWYAVGTVTKPMVYEGRYTYYVWANDSAGNSGSTETRSVVYDITKPSLFLISPQNVTYDSTTIALNYSVFDASPRVCRYTYNGTNTTLANCTNSTFTAVRNAASVLTVWANDSAGNMNSTGIAFTTAVPPAILFAYPANESLLNPPSLTGIMLTAVNITTDVSSECRFATTNGTAFLNMTSFASTNSTVHNMTVNIADAGRYPFYVRCRDMSGNVNQNDYYFYFRTADGSNKLVVDPGGSILKNNTVSIDILKNGIKRLNISVRNAALSDASNISLSVKGSGAAYTSANLAANAIPANSTRMLEIVISPNETGSYLSTITVKAGASVASFNISVTVYEDFLPDLNALKAKRIKLVERLSDLQAGKSDVDDLISKADSILSDINDATSAYNSEKYSEAKDKLLGITGELDSLEAKVIEKESLQKSQKNKNDDIPSLLAEPSTDKGSDSDTIWIVAGAVIIAVIAVVLATSVMPDEEGNNEEELDSYEEKS